MSKVKLFISAIAMSLGLSAFAQGDVVEGYTVDFNTTISIPYSGSWKVAPGWSHIVDATYAPSYSYYASGGVDGTGRLLCGMQNKMGYDSNWNYVTKYMAHDLLVTPAVTGTVTIAVKGSSASYMNFAFYKINADGTMGDSITTTTCSGVLNTTDYVTYTLKGLANEKIGIWGSSVSIDNFTASNAVIEYEKGLTLSTAKLTSSYSPDCDADGNYTVSADVTVKNTGECSLSDYTVSVYNGTLESKRVLGSETIAEELPVGAEKTITITGTANVNTDKTEETTACQWYAAEDVTSTTKYIAKVTPCAYLPSLAVSNSDGAQTSPLTTDFGYINADKTQTYTIANAGAAPMTITSISTPDAGFSVEVKQGDEVLTTPFTLAAHATATMTVTALSSEMGAFEKTIVISGENVDPFTINLKSNVLDATKLYVNFEDGKIPAGFVNEGSWSTGSYGYNGNQYCVKQSSSSATKLITPLLEVTSAEDVLKFDVAKGSSYYEPTLNILYSTDRVNWTTLKEFTADEIGTEYAPGTSYTYGLVTHEVSGIPAGKYYIAFEGSRVNIDNIYGLKKVDVAHDLMLTSTSVPATAMQNNAYTVSASVKNINDKDDNAYAELYVNEEKVATSEAQDIASLATATFSFSQVPHQLGDNTVYVKVIAGEQELTSETATVNVTEEVASAEVTVGNASSSLAYNGAVKTYYKYSQSEIIYTAEKLAASGLKKGDKISSMTFRGSNGGGITPTMQFYLSNTDNTDVADKVNGSVATMTKVFDGEYTLPTSSELCDMIVINFTEPFVYDGGNLRLAAKSACTSDNYAKYEVDNTDNTGSVCYLKWKGNEADCNAASMASSSYGDKFAIPVVHFGLQVEATVVAAAVTDSQTGAPVEGATIEIKNVENDVIYTGTTDVNGNVVVPVIQNSLAYTVTVSKERYETQTVVENKVLFAEAPAVTYEISLVPTSGTSISNVATINENNAVRYNLAGQRVNATAKGIVIMNGKKFLNK